MTPVSSEPIWLARRMRWLSPPESDGAARSSVRYVRPTSSRNFSRERISFRSSVAILASAPFSSRVSKKAYDSATESAVTSAIVRPAIFTPRASRRTRRPPHAEHGREERYFW